MSTFRKHQRWMVWALLFVAFGAAVYLPAQIIPGNLGGSSGGSGTSLPVADTQTLVKGSADATKLLRFEVDGFTTGTTRVVTFQNADQTVAGLGLNNAFTGVNTYASGSIVVGASGSAGSQIINAAASTPDSPGWFTGTTSNSLLIAEQADVAFDFAHAASTHPALHIHSTNQSTSEFSTFSFAGVQSSRNTVTVNGATTFAITSGYIVLECTGAETINTITGAPRAGTILYLENSDTECTIADDDSATATDAVDLTGTATSDVGAVAKVITLIYNGSHWLQTAESDN